MAGTEITPQSKNGESSILDSSSKAAMETNRLGEQYMDELFTRSKTDPDKVNDSEKPNQSELDEAKPLILDLNPRITQKSSDSFSKAPPTQGNSDLQRVAATDIPGKILQVLDNVFGMTQTQDFQRDGALHHTTAIFSDGHSRTEYFEAGKKLATELKFPAKDGDPRGEVSLEISQQNVSTRYGNPLIVAGKSISSIESQAGVAELLFKNPQGEIVQLSQDEISQNRLFLSDVIRNSAIARFEISPANVPVPVTGELLGLTPQEGNAIQAFQNQYTRSDGSRYLFGEAIAAMDPQNPLRTSEQINTALDLQIALDRDKATALLDPFGRSSDADSVGILATRIRAPLGPLRMQEQAVADFQRDPVGQAVPDLQELLSLDKSQRLSIGLLQERGEQKGAAELSLLAGWRSPEQVQEALNLQGQLSKLQMDAQTMPPSPEVLPAGVVRIGNRDYQLSYGASGQTNRLFFSSPDGASVLEMVRHENGSLQISKCTGEYLPKNGLVNLEGLPVMVDSNGMVIGDISFNSKGDLKYKTGNGPDRVEYTRKADGSQVMVDFKSWKRTMISASGQMTEHYWDGYEWRNGKLSADGKRIDFAPPDPNKPSYVQRDTSNGQDTTVVSFADGWRFDCDWKRRLQIRNIPGDPPQQKTMYYNGAGYQEAQQISKDQPRPGDVTLVFKYAHTGEPKSVVLRPDGSMASLRPDNTMVEKDALGYVTSVTGPKGTWNFERDVNGDIQRASHSYIAADGRQINQVMTRRGPEINPGMEYWLSRQAIDGPRTPTEPPPRDLNKPTGYTTFIDSTGQVINMNINVTADGTIRIERASANNEQAYVSYEPPGQDLYKDDGTQLIYEHAGGVNRLVNKQTKETIVSFTRNGQEFSLNSKNGELVVAPDGTVTQDHLGDQTRAYYMTNGLIAVIGRDNSTPPKPMVKEVRVPGKQGQYSSLKEGVDGVSGLTITEDMLVTANVNGPSGAMQVVFNLKDGTRGEKNGTERFWRINDKDGNFVGLGNNAGQATWNIAESAITGNGGVSYDRKNWEIAQPPVGPNGELLLIGKGSHSGTTIKLDLGGVAIESTNGVDVYRYSTMSQARYENGKLVSVTSRGKLFKPELPPGANGPVTAVIDENGKRITAIPTTATFQFDRTVGKFVADVRSVNGVQQGLYWEPSNNTYSAGRTWLSSNGKQMNFNVWLDEKNQVVEFELPGVEKTFAVAGNAEVKSAGYDVSTGQFKVTLPNGMFGQFNADGTFDWQSPLAGSEPSHYNRDGVWVANDQQGKSLQAELAALGAQASQEALQKFAVNLLNRFAIRQYNSAQIAGFVDDLNRRYLNALDPSVSLSTQSEDGNQIIVTLKIGTGESMETKTITYPILTS